MYTVYIFASFILNESLARYGAHYTYISLRSKDFMMFFKEKSCKSRVWVVYVEREGREGVECRLNLDKCNNQ